MATLGNWETQELVMPALGRMAKLSLPIDGALLTVKAIRELGQHLRDVEQVRLETLKTFAELDAAGEFAMQTNDEGKPTTAVKFRDDEARQRFNEFYQELMQNTFETDLCFQRKHFEDEKHPWQGSPELLAQLGELIGE